jgi:hypothetical protein
MANPQEPCWKVETEDALLLPTGSGETQCYRVKDGQVEFHSNPRSRWRRLAPTDLLQHIKWNTAVAEWLKRRLVISRAEGGR